MIPPLLRVFVRQPHLVLDHLRNYADLFRHEMRGVASNALRGFICWMVFAIALALFLVFSGVALMLGLMQGQFHWILLAVPLTMLALALIAFVLARRPVMQGEIAAIQQQMAADLNTLHAAGERNG